jgi:3-oxoacyl-(acyl-carrier-protein) synthase
VITLAEARWPLSDVDALPALAGFVESTFSPLAAEVARRCLESAEPIAETAVIIVSSTGDLATARATARAVDSGGRLGPLLFFQAVPNAIAGYIAAKWHLCGPVVCLSPAEPDLAEGLAVAELLFLDGDANQALIISVEQAKTESERDTARAVLVKGAV